MNTGALVKKKKNRRGGRAVRERIAKAKLRDQKKLEAILISLQPTPNSSEVENHIREVFDQTDCDSNDTVILNSEQPNDQIPTFYTPDLGSEYTTLEPEVFVEYSDQEPYPKVTSIQRTVEYQGSHFTVDTVETTYTRQHIEVHPPHFPPQPSTPKIVEIIDLE